MKTKEFKLKIFLPTAIQVDLKSPELARAVYNVLTTLFPAMRDYCSLRDGKLLFYLENVPLTEADVEKFKKELIEKISPREYVIR